MVLPIRGGSGHGEHSDRRLSLAVASPRAGEPVLAEELASHERRAAGAPPIWGLDREDDKAYEGRIAAARARKAGR
jgi:hypothetical protein